MPDGDKVFGGQNTFLSPVLFLLLFVFSVLVCGLLVLGKPLKFYIDGRKKEAVSLLFYSL
jgi:hypothetical protein